MKLWIPMLMIWSAFLIGLSAGSYHQRTTMQTAIADNGCSKQAQIELKPTKSNADVYNYAALSTSY